MKKILSIITFIAFAICFRTSCGAEAFYRCGDWTLTMINGTEDYTFGVDSYTGEADVVTVPGDYGGFPIIAINSHAFAANTVLRDVTLTDQIVTIGKGAFLSASNLERVNLTPSVTSIDESAFSYTSALKEINLADSSISAVPENTFFGSGIENVVLPETCVSIGDNAFANCGDLATIRIPDSVTEISDSAFLDSDKVLICATSGSYAIRYATKHGIFRVFTDEVSYVLGDTDENGEVTINDVTVIQQYLADYSVSNQDAVVRNGYVEGEGLNISDATLIQMYIAQMQTIYPIGKSVEIQ